MKNILILLICLLSINSFSQSTFDKSLSEISNDIANKLNQKNQKKIVVLYITDIKKTQSVAGKYMADVISYNIVNNPLNFFVFDRENLSEITEAKKLIDEGYIDAAKAKELGKILAVDAIIIGNYTVLPSTLKLSLKALDVNSGLIVAASMKDLPLNEDAGSLLGIHISNNDGGSSTNRGFNTPIKSGVNYNNPGTVDRECEKNNTGDFCFLNETKGTIYVYVSERYLTLPIQLQLYANKISIASRETSCLYNTKAKVLYYSVTLSQSSRAQIWKSGQIRVEKCKSKTLTIK